MSSIRNPAVAHVAVEQLQQPASSSSQNKRRQPLADSNNNNNKNQEGKQQQPYDPKLLNDNVDRMIQNLRQIKNEQVEAVQANWISEQNNTHNIYASAMVKIPRNIKAMTLSEFNAIYKTDLLATLLQRQQQPPPLPQSNDAAAATDEAEEEEEHEQEDPMEQTLQMGTVLKGGKKSRPQPTANKKPAPVATSAVTAPPAASAAPRAIGPAVAAVAASFQHANTGAATTGGTTKRGQPITTPSNTKRYPVTTPSGRQARHGEVLFSKNGSPVEAGPVRAIEHDVDTYIVATVTKKKRRPQSGGIAGAQGGAGGQEEEESVMAFGIDVGGGEYISLQDATVATQLDPAKKNAALFQLQQLKEQVDTVMKNLQINNNNNEI